MTMLPCLLLLNFEKLLSINFLLTIENRMVSEVVTLLKTYYTLIWMYILENNFSFSWKTTHHIINTLYGNDRIQTFTWLHVVCCSSDM